jgi:hypothetical protein
MRYYYSFHLQCNLPDREIATQSSTIISLIHTSLKGTTQSKYNPETRGISRPISKKRGVFISVIKAKQEQDLGDDRHEAAREGATELAGVMLRELAHRSFKPIHSSGSTRKSL